MSRCNSCINQKRLMDNTSAMCAEHEIDYLKDRLFRYEAALKQLITKGHRDSCANEDIDDFGSCDCAAEIATNALKDG